MDDVILGVMCLAVFLPFLAALVHFSNSASNAARKAQQELEDAQTKYQMHLDSLKRDPANADIYQKTLQAGREYSNLTRQRQGVTVYDEVALSNDLSAATAGAKKTVQTPTPDPISIPGGVSAAERMRQLDDLRSQGLITDQEYATKRAQILQNL